MTKLLFLGSNWEALSTFKVLNNDKRFKIVGLITQPDKPVGRKHEIVETEIKAFAKANSIPVFHTNNLKENYKKALDLYDPEIIVCKSFGEMIPGFFLKYPKFKSINVHYSLLPKYRGAVPIQKAILEGDSITGITYVKMVKKLDSGGILKQIDEKILPTDTNQSLRERLVTITGETICDTLNDWIDGNITLTPQDDSLATYCQQSDISKDNAYIDWNVIDPIKVERMVRAFIPWPVAWTYFNDKRLKIFECSFFERETDLKPGQYKLIENELVVGTTGKSIILKSVQLEGKNIVSGQQFALGQKI